MRLVDVVVVVFLCLGLLTSTGLVTADGSIGCVFRKSLCRSKIEWCFDDYVFGRCIPHYERKADFYRYDLNGEALRLIKRELVRLMNLGYRWSHFYTQCVLKALLFSLRYQKDYNESLCNVYLENPEPLDYTEDSELIDPRDEGQLKFTPTLEDLRNKYNDIYIPFYDQNNILEEVVLPKGSNERVQYSKNPKYDMQKALLLNILDKEKRSKSKNYGAREAEELRIDDIPDYYAYSKDITGDYASDLDYDDSMQNQLHFTQPYNTPDHFREGLESKDYDKSFQILEKLIAQDRDNTKSFSRNYNTPEKFRKGHETKDEVLYPKEAISDQNQDVYFIPDQRQLAYDTYGIDSSDLKRESDGVYTEGGVVYPKSKGEGDSESSNSFEDLMKRFNSLGFKRPERLDVKKPGPSFSTNNYAFVQDKDRNKEEKGVKAAFEKAEEKSTARSQQPNNNILSRPEKKKVGSPMESPTLRRQTTTMQTLKEQDEKLPEQGDGEYAFMVLKNRVNTWQEGSRIVRKIEELLRLNPNTFSNVKVNQNEIKFRVDPNRLHWNASDVIRRIENHKDVLQRAIGAEIVSTGVGEQNRPSASLNMFDGDESQLWILSFLLCGVIAAVAIAGAAFFVIRRHSHTKDKLQNLTQLDSEASKDYQDLCRARMATKAAQDKPEGPGHRVTNLAKEPEGNNHSPSSRSSTSSWSEEPALTNMDISTGHMVLSYMEDHLKNKDRLEQEWIALCAYEAEPCATAVAVKGENGKKNRYADVLPYDHARVVLNELSNITGSDYINASTITDHDPRNPAYIASQGPLLHTAADFWQMVWEQGSVVMVMLTRLTENGTAMCHRYWPEEGSELYHIYEVHLVSEHIWCDDYLVRSFYLKNIKTGETRTVTQFHFLSWPENGIPLSTKALLEFRRKVNKSYRGRSCPIVVHCSDGVGRTGTYCLIDMVLNRMAKGAKEIDIAATLEHIRDQRPLMVRTKQQFEFVLMAVAEEVHAILKALPANPNHSPPPILKEKE